MANVQSQRTQRSCAQRNKKEKKIVPWYLDMPCDFLRLCVAVLHRKCVLYFHWSRISGWKLQWIFSEWDVKYFIIFFLHLCKETCCLPEKDGRRKVSLPDTGIWKIIFMNSSCSYHGQLEPRPSGLVPCPCWWCPLVSAAQSGPRAFTAAAGSCPLCPHQHIQDGSLTGNGEADEGGRRNGG